MPSFETWLARAEQYVTNAEQLHGTDNNEAMVQLAQAAEYALKGLQVERDGSHRRGHDLLGFAHEESVPQRFHSTLSYLEQAYARRYPDDPQFTVSDFTGKKQDIEQLLEWVSTQSQTNS
jgi:HEPN domain-containing protein